MLCSSDVSVIKAEIEKHRKKAREAYERYSMWSVTSGKTYEKHTTIANALEAALEADEIQRRNGDTQRRLAHYRYYMNDEVYKGLHAALLGQNEQVYRKMEEGARENE